MVRTGLVGRTLGVLGVVATLCSSAQAQTLDAHYSVSLMGIRVGDLYASGQLQPQSYRMDVHAQLSGVAAMVSSLRLALVSTGAVNKRGALAPATYATTSASTESTRTLRMALSSGTVRAVEITPPPEWHGERVPITDAQKRNVLDPTSALIMPVPLKEPLVGPSACQRTLPVYDGFARFDIALSFVEERTVTIGSYTGPVSVCSARYRPIAGHLVASRATAFMAQNTGIEVWLAPVESVHVVVPLRVAMPTMAGQLDIEAINFQTGTSAQSAR